jgi:hypothetical protein
MPKNKPPENVEEADPETEAAAQEYLRLYNSLSMDEKIAYRRSTGLRTLLRWRYMMAKYPNQCPPEFYRQRLRDSQIELLKLRAWRATGIEPGRG